MSLENTLSELYDDMKQKGDRIQYFSPYIPLTMTYSGDKPPEGFVIYGEGFCASTESVAYAEKVNSSGERNVWTSDLIRSLGGFNDILKELKDEISSD